MQEEATQAQYPPSPLGRRLDYLNQWWRGMKETLRQTDLKAYAYFSAVLFPDLENAARDAPNDPRREYNHRLIADAALQAVGIAPIESATREGVGPQIMLDPDESRRLHRASMQSDHFNNLPVCSFDLPGLPGRGLINLIFDARRASFALTLMPSPIQYKEQEVITSKYATDITTDDVKKIMILKIGAEIGAQKGEEKNEGNRHYYSYESQLLARVNELLETRYCNLRLGSIPMSSKYFDKKYEATQAGYAMADYAQNPRLPEGWQVERYSAPEDTGAITYHIKTIGGDTEYTLSLQINKQTGDGADSILLRKTAGSIPHDASFEEFHKGLNTDIMIIQSVLDWLYRYAETNAGGHAPTLHLPDNQLAQFIETSGIVHELGRKDLMRSFAKLGGQRNNKQELKALARAVIAHIKEGAKNPKHALITGTSGAGKTSLAMATLHEIAEAGIPVYQVQSSPKVAEIFAKDPINWVRLFLLATVNNGVIYIPDIDIAMGVSEETRKINMDTLNALLETTLRIPGVWVLADTARHEELRESLVEPHRFGANWIKVGIDTDPKDVREIVTQVIMNELAALERGSDYETVMDSFDMEEVVTDIALSGDITPAQIARMINRMLLIRTDRPITTETFLNEIRSTREWNADLRKRREEAKHNGLAEQIKHAQRLIGELEARIAALEMKQSTHSNEEKITDPKRKIR